MSDIEAIRARHHESATWDSGNPRAGADHRVHWCSCSPGQDWPCDTAILLAALAEREAAVAIDTAMIVRLLAHTTTGDGCWEWQGPYNTDGYGLLAVKGQMLRVHRLSHELFVGPIPDSFMVCHRCDNPPCIRPDHLYAGTAKDNTRDALERGQFPVGERHGQAKLTRAAAAEIRALYVEGRTYPELAARFGVTERAINGVLIGETWNPKGDAEPLRRDASVCRNGHPRSGTPRECPVCKRERNRSRQWAGHAYVRRGASA